jgi:GDP-L-fucose synthase
MDRDARILVTGQCGWVGGAVARRLWVAGFDHIRLLMPDEVDLTRPARVDDFFLRHRPQYVFLTAARQGTAGARPDEAIRESLAVQANVIHAAWRAGVRKLCFLASSSIHPAGVLPLLREEALLSAAIGPGEDGEVLAQVAGIRMCQVYRRRYRFDAISAVPAELYGPGDSPGAQAGALPALVRRLYEAQADGATEMAIDALPARAWLQVDDFADAALFLMRGYSSEVPVNVDGAEEIAFAEVLRMAADAVGYRGRLVQQTRAPPARRARPEGLRLNAMGWAPCMPLREGIEQMCAWYLQGTGAAPA